MSYRTAAEDLRPNPGQWQAYCSTGHCVVLAGPGSGKTKTLTIKMSQLLHEETAAPRGIACLTYSTECARELRRRLDPLDVRESANVFIGTVHSFCFKEIVLPYARIAGLGLPLEPKVALRSEQERIFAAAVSELSGADERAGAWKTPAENYRLTHLDRSTEDWLEDPDLAALIERYETLLRAENMIDFDDMVLIALGLVRAHEWVRKAIKARFPILVVDEYQDLGVPLHEMVHALCLEGGIRLFAVGDPDQSIYGFNGARPDLLRALAVDARVERVHLQFNYRSGPTIVQAAGFALGEDRGYESRGPAVSTIDFYKKSDGLNQQVETVCTEIIPGALARLGDVPLGRIAVLYRSRYDGDVVAAVATDHGFPIVRTDAGSAYRRTPLTRWMEECAQWCNGGWRVGVPRLSSLAHCWLSLGTRRPTHEIAARRRQLIAWLWAHRSGAILLRDWLAEFVSTGLVAVLDRDPTLRDERLALADLITASATGGPLADWTVAQLASQGGSPDHLNLITLHSAKGLEFEVVIMVGLEQGVLPGWRDTATERLESRRLFYVGLTRAMREVHLTFSGWRENAYGRRFNNGPSEFLLEVRRRLNEVGE